LARVARPASDMPPQPDWLPLKDLLLVTPPV
jgi:hypothetical protein